MIDLTDSFSEGVKIFKKDNFRRKPIPENYRCSVKGMLVVRAYLAVVCICLNERGCM